MDDALAHQLINLTSQFYGKAASSFSATRQQPWEGWEQLWELAAPRLRIDAEGPMGTPRPDEGSKAPEGSASAHLGTMGGPTAERPLRVLDVGCGNLRFEQFLEAKAPGAWEAWAVDDCPALMAEGASDGTLAKRTTLQQLDVMGALLEGAGVEELADAFDPPPVDLAVAFGFLHHVPGADARERLMRALARSVRPGGLVAVSLWQFADDERLRAKAKEATARGRAALDLPPLDPGDYLLGWQHDPHLFRYGHSFTEAEADELAQPLAPQARELVRFSADGKSGQLNRYLLLERASQ